MDALMETIVVAWFYAWGALTAAAMLAMTVKLSVDAVRSWRRVK